MEIGPDSKKAFDIMAQGGETVPFQGNPEGDSPEAPTTQLDPTAPLKSTTTTLLKMKQDVEKIAADVGKDNSYKIGALNSIAQFQTAPEKQIAFYQLMRESIGNKYLAPFVEYMGRELAQEETAKKQALLQYLDNERNIERQKVVAEFQLRKQAEIDDSRLKREREKQSMAELQKWAPLARNPEVVARIAARIKDKGEDFFTARDAVATTVRPSIDLVTGKTGDTTEYLDPFDLNKGWRNKYKDNLMDAQGRNVGTKVVQENPFTGESRVVMYDPQGQLVPAEGMVRFPPKGKSGGSTKTAPPRGRGYSAQGR